MEELKDVIIADSFDELGTEKFEDYLAHALCLGGSCTFDFNGRKFELQKGDVMIVRKGRLVENLTPSNDFRVKVVYVTTGFITLSIPQSNYGTKGQLALFLNPVMRLTPEQQEVCRCDFETIEFRLGKQDNHFYREVWRKRSIPTHSERSYPPHF